VEQQVLVSRRDHVARVQDGQDAGLVRVRHQGLAALHGDGQPSGPQRRAAGDAGEPRRGLGRRRPPADHRA
jgi:hypothetical protein